jgi:phenylalanyl-tRNA synthetase beta subunit
MTRDIAMWVPEGILKEDVEKILNESAGALRVRTTHVDAFTKDGRTSLAFRLVFQSMEQTLTDEEIGLQMDLVYKKATAQGWETR